MRQTRKAVNRCFSGGMGKNRPETSFRSLLRLRPLASGDTPSTGGGTGTPIMPRTIEFQLIWRYGSSEQVEGRDRPTAPAFAVSGALALASIMLSEAVLALGACSSMG